MALVTGAASGIGHALTKALRVRGALVHATDLDLTRLEAVYADDPRVSTHRLDVTDAEAFSALVESIEREAPIDVLVNNAGVGLSGELRDLEVANWRPVVEVNLWGVVHGLHACYARMVARKKGCIINVASGAGLAPRPGMVPYAATKAGVVALSTSLQPEARGYGVSVHVACPGFVATDIMNRSPFVGLDAAALTASIPVRAMTAETCANQILRGVERGRGLIVLSTVLKLDYWLWRCSPRLSMWLARGRAQAFRRHRLARSGDAQIS